MMLRILVLLCLFTTTLTAQISSPENDTLRKHLIFEENFDNNDKAWLDEEDLNPSISQAHSSEIKNGLLHYGVIKKSIPLATTPNDRIDFSKDFEIEYSCKILSAKKKNKFAVTLFWGRDTLNSSCYLYAAPSGKMTLVDCTNGGFKNCDKHKVAEAVWKEGTFNKIVLRKIKGTYSLYVNNKFVKDYPYKELRGSMIGLGAGPGTQVAYDYIKVYHLE